MQIAGIVQDDAEIDELIKSESDIDPNIWSNIHLEHVERHIYVCVCCVLL